MAVHPDHRGLEVEIVVHEEVLRGCKGKELWEGSTDITRYVQASSRTHFTTRYTESKALYTNYSASIAIRVNGVQDKTTFRIASNARIVVLKKLKTQALSKLMKLRRPASFIPKS